MKVVPFKREAWRDAVGTLRTIADQIESGELPPCAVGALAMRSSDGGVTAFGFGPAADDLQALALFRLGGRKVEDFLMEVSDGVS